MLAGIRGRKWGCVNRWRMDWGGLLDLIFYKTGNIPVFQREECFRKGLCSYVSWMDFVWGKEMQWDFEDVQGSKGGGSPGKSAGEIINN